MSTPECGTNQNPRKMTLPVMFATNTWPSTSTLIASTSPVANVSSSSPVTVNRSETGEVTATCLPYSCGVRSSVVIVVIRVMRQSEWSRFISSR